MNNQNEYEPKYLRAKLAKENYDYSEKRLKQLDETSRMTEMEKRTEAYHRKISEKTGNRAMPPRCEPIIWVQWAVQEPKFFFIMYDIAVNNFCGPAQPKIIQVHDREYVIFEPLNSDHNKQLTKSPDSFLDKFMGAIGSIFS